MARRIVGSRGAHADVDGVGIFVFEEVDFLDGYGRHDVLPGGHKGFAACLHDDAVLVEVVEGARGNDVETIPLVGCGIACEARIALDGNGGIIDNALSLF